MEAGGRWQRFDTAGTLLGGQPVTRSLGCGLMDWRADEFFAVTIEVGEDRRRDRTSLFIVHDRGEDGEVTPRDTLAYPALPERETFTWTADRATIVGTVPLTHRPTFTVGPDGDLWITEGGGDYRIRRQSLEGDTLLVIERIYESVPVPDSVRNAEIEALNREDAGFPDDFDRDDIPRVFPPFDRMYVATDGTLWVRRQVEGGAYALDIFDSTGVYLGAVSTFEGFGDVIIHQITPTHLYGRVTDELDVPYVARWRIARRGR